MLHAMQNFKDQTLLKKKQVPGDIEHGLPLFPYKIAHFGMIFTPNYI